MKTCRGCNVEKPLDQFYKDGGSSDGHVARCKECRRAQTRKWNAKNKEKKNAARIAWRLANKEKELEITRAWRAKNHERYVENNRAYAERNSARAVEKVRQWRLKNPDRVKPARASEQARRRAAQRMASPAWANKAMIDWLYELAAKYSEMTGVPHEVDHIIPMKGRRACGLHVEHNLRIITASENRKKSAKSLNFNGAIRVEWF